jgi:F-type H+-transporting ATPase subunit g
MEAARPNAQWFMRYAKIELAPPTPGEIPTAIKQFTQLLSSAGRGSWKNLTVRVRRFSP